jgi:uncharacterized protein (DUF58 family)
MMTTALRGVLHPLRSINARIERWVLTRVQRLPGPVTIRRQRIYILPTRQGTIFAVMTFALLLGAMNYSNSLGFALSFLLAGLGLVCMHHTHGNLVNLQLSSRGGVPVFAGETMRFAVALSNPSRRSRHVIALTLKQGDWGDHWTDVPADGEATTGLDVKTSRRGRVRAPRFAVSSRFPLGLFYAWTWVELDQSGIAYPKPLGPTLPDALDGDEGFETAASQPGNDDFAGVRDYHRGDALSSIHWKVSARSGELVVKQFAQARRDEIVLNFDRLTDPDPELRVSQLARWVLDAAERGLSWALILPDQQIAADTGSEHCARCLTALALYGADEA